FPLISRRPTDATRVPCSPLFRSSTQVGSVNGTTTSYTETGLGAGTYSYTVKAVDAAGNLSDPSNSASGTVPDTTKPTAPGTLTATASAGQVALSWQPSSDNVGVTGYRVFHGSTQHVSATASTNSRTDTAVGA